MQWSTEDKERDKICLGWEWEWVLHRESTKMGLERWIEFCKFLGNLLNLKNFNVRLFFTIHSFPTSTFPLEVYVSFIYISEQTGSGNIIEINFTMKCSVSRHWQSMMGRQLLELSTCWNYFLSVIQDVIKLKNIGLGQNNRGWIHVWKLFSRGLTTNQKKVEEEVEEDTVERAWLRGTENSNAVLSSDIHGGCDLRAISFC